MLMTKASMKNGGIKALLSLCLFVLLPLSGTAQNGDIPPEKLEELVARALADGRRECEKLFGAEESGDGEDEERERDARLCKR